MIIWGLLTWARMYGFEWLKHNILKRSFQLNEKCYQKYYERFILIFGYLALLVILCYSLLSHDILLLSPFISFYIIVIVVPDFVLDIVRKSRP